MPRTDSQADMDRPSDKRSSWRRRLPAIATIVVLAAAAAIVWTNLLTEDRSLTSGVSCPQAPATAHLSPLPYGALRDVRPSPPRKIAVLVRNSTSRHDLAARVAARLQLLGFAESAPPDNDPVYRTDGMYCVGQIRFGPNGRAAARTVSLVAPCAQLVRDDSRTDSIVHLVVGTDFTALSPNGRARDVLRALRGLEVPKAEPAGGLQSLSGADANTPVSVPSGAHSC
jgi:LytR cell envelope-related transcriptional attenuator